MFKAGRMDGWIVTRERKKKSSEKGEEREREKRSIEMGIHTFNYNQTMKNIFFSYLNMYKNHLREISNE